MTKKKKLSTSDYSVGDAKYNPADGKIYHDVWNEDLYKFDFMVNSPTPVESIVDIYNKHKTECLNIFSTYNNVDVKIYLKINHDSSCYDSSCSDVDVSLQIIVCRDEEPEERKKRIALEQANEKRLREQLEYDRQQKAQKRRQLRDMEINRAKSLLEKSGFVVEAKKKKGKNDEQ